MNPLAVIEIFLGGVMAFMGYRLFVDALRLWGFLIVGMIGALAGGLLFPGVVPLFNLGIPLTRGAVLVTLPILVGFIGFGVAGALLAQPIKVGLAFLIGFIATAAAATLLYQMILGGSNLLVALGLGALVGLLAIRWEEVVLIISTAFLGSALVTFGLIILFPSINNIIAAIIFFLAGFFGSAAQYRDAHPG